MLKGELIIVGADSIVIDLHNTKHPEDISVKFHGAPTWIPCNSAHIDDLQWFCSQSSTGGFLLTISWSVSTPREIKWSACW